MAYDQGYYQAPQRPYNGRAAQPPVQAYGQGAPAHAYPPQGPYDQQAHDGYGQDDYNNGYSENYDNQYQQPMNNGGHGGRGQYPPQNPGYPPQQEYYGNGGGRGEEPRSQSRAGGRGGPPPQGRPPMMDNGRGPIENRGGGGNRGYPNGNGIRADGRGGRPPPVRAGHSDPGARRQVPPPQRSPQTVAWDTPFPSFPGSGPKKKGPETDEQNLTQQMGSMGIDDPRNQQRPASRNGVDPRSRGMPAGDGYSRPSGDSQRSTATRGYPPQQPQQPQPGFSGPAAHRPGPGSAPMPAPALGYGRPKQNGYGSSGYDPGYTASTPASPIRDDFAPISRSMTLPNDLTHNTSMGPNGGPKHPSQSSIAGPGPSAPYSGPIGRGPPRPATANEVRQPPQREYQQPAPQQYYTNDVAPSGRHEYSHYTMESISDFYDAYYEPRSRGHSMNNEILDYENQRISYNNQMGRGTSRDDYGGTDPNSIPHRQQVNGYPPINHTESQPDFRAQLQPQAAVYEMVGDAPTNRVNPQMSFPDEGYGQQHNQPEIQNGPRNAGYGNSAGQSYDEKPQQTNPSRQNGSISRGPQGGSAPYANGNGMAPQNTNPPRPHGPEVLPAHPTPVRPGLIPNSVASQTQANNKPPPVRNYGNTTTQSPAPKPPSQLPPIKAPPPGPPAVTLDELERLKVIVKGNPNDQASSLLISRKWVEAADVLTAALDQKARTKTRERYLFDAHKMLKKLVASQNSDAMFFLADCYGRGLLNIENESKEAFSLYQSAAKAGHAAAAYRTAVCCELGNEEGGGTRKDPMKAIQWYQRAATLGDTPAMYKMGMIQLKGLLGQPKNPREAVTWLKRAAERADAENPHALHELGLLYETVQSPDGSSSVIRDEAYALSLFQQAAELGYKFSQFRLGCTYEYGLFNLNIDARMSIMWYSRAAVQEEHQSELALSGWYLTGSEGVLQQSDTEAYLWARKAAMAGLAKAEYAMGYFTEVGIGAPADIEGAKRWYWRAAAQNFPKARERLEDLKKGGSKPQLKSRERVSRSRIGKQNEGECAVM